MHLSCIICSDILTPSAEIHTTHCGHLFHYVCLIKWIERSCTCPQCRCKISEKTIHRVYFNLANADGIQDDAVTLQYKMDNMDFQIKLKDKDIQICKDKNKKLKEQNIALRTEVQELENKQTVSASVMHALKEQVAFFKLKAKETKRLSDEVTRLKDKLKELEHVQLVVTGTKDQVTDMLRHNKDPHSLSFLVLTLKKELLESDRKYKLLNTNLKHLQNDISKYRNENSEIIKENNKLKHDIECHKDCESQRIYLKKKIAQIEKQLLDAKPSTSQSNDTSLNRIIMESPAPQRKRIVTEIDVIPENTKSPTLDERVQIIKESESPYLSIKSSNVGLSCLVNPKFINTTQTQRGGVTNIFKNPASSLDSIKKNNSEYSYDGLGGHKKEDTFPTPKPIIGMKRSKSATISSSKFRKLAPNKKISNFFTDTDA
ncbi:Ring finger domain [Popillia japonica]|uniref:Ring finger domain n=1 Tax=Popillia japonica TaxID=7064 RepID=A0AAW1L695_POPJA